MRDCLRCAYSRLEIRIWYEIWKSIDFEKEVLGKVEKMETVGWESYSVSRS